MSPLKTSWTPTHELTWTPSDRGKPRRWLVAIKPDPAAPGGMIAFTKEDWENQTPSWIMDCTSRRWQWLGFLPGPDGKQGTVTLRRVDGQTDTTPRGLKIIY